MEVDDYSDISQENGTDVSLDQKIKYNELLSKIDLIGETTQADPQTAKKLNEIVECLISVDTSSEGVKYESANETYLDSMVLSSTASALFNSFETIKLAEQKYLYEEFAENIRSFCENTPGAFHSEDLIKLIPYADDIIPQELEYSYVYGTYNLDTLPKPKIKSKTETHKQESSKKPATNLTSTEKEEKSINEIVKLLYTVLEMRFEKNGNNPVKYYDYIIDTSSFENTIENMFYFSFLVRDGKADFDLRDKIPYIKPIKRNELKAYRGSEGVNFQVVTALTMAEWKTFKKEGYVQQYKKSNVSKK